MGKILPFVIPSKEAKVAEIKCAADLLANKTAIKKANFTTDQESFEFAIFPESGEILAVCLTRDIKGNVVDGYVRRVPELDGLNWFEGMQKRIS